MGLIEGGPYVVSDRGDFPDLMPQRDKNYNCYCYPGGRSWNNPDLMPLSICEEFDWKPINEDIAHFCKAFIPPEEHRAFAMAIVAMRNDPVKFVEKFEEFKRLLG